MNKLKIFLIIFCLICGMVTTVKAENGIEFYSNKENIIVGEEFSVLFSFWTDEIAACDITFYYDTAKLEYISGPENSNQVEDNILYTWADETGGVGQKRKIENRFTFVAKQEGVCSFSGIGIFYNRQEQEINFEIPNFKIVVKSDVELLTENVIDENNAKLDILRLNQEGISPDFKSDITQYYLTVGEEIQNIEITAIPQEKNAVMVITGNTSLQNGLNNINISVTSPNGNNKMEYVIEVTRTSSREQANTNLVTLAIENTLLYPEFYANVTNYKVEVRT